MNGLELSGLGAMGQSMKIDQISNNIANANTPGFRRDTMAFAESLSRALDANCEGYNALARRKPGAPVIDVVGFEKQGGGYEVTRRPLDLALVGGGWFNVQDVETGEIFHTRAGNFEMNGDGRLTTSDGRRQVLADDGRAIALDPANAEKLLVREDGSLAQGDVECGRLGITGFEDESRLRKYGDNLVRNEGSSASGTPVGARVEQGTLERSGVNPVLEMVEMIKAFRVLETNLEMVRLQDAALDRAVNDAGRPQR
jgi:flagellar basal-body rod protein FlgF